MIYVYIFLLHNVCHLYVRVDFLLLVPRRESILIGTANLFPPPRLWFSFLNYLPLSYFPSPRARQSGTRDN